MPAPLTAETSAVQVFGGMRILDPDDTGVLANEVAALGYDAPDQAWELDTQAGADFVFTISKGRAGNTGTVNLQIEHLLAGGSVPQSGAESLLEEGIAPEGPGLSYQGDRLNARGDGFARVTLRGNVSRDQVLLIREGNELCALRLRVGALGPINFVPESGAPAAILSSTDICSSDSARFGLPSIAVSGDRYSIALYDGDSSDQWSWERQLVWLQYDQGTGEVFGTRLPECVPDTGSWRDQEIAALDNVLAIVRADGAQTVLELSFDRGGSFPTREVLMESDVWGQRLPQIAVAPDYTIGVIYWRSRFDAKGADLYLNTELVLVEASPSAVDTYGQPTAYQLGSQQILCATSHNISNWFGGWTTPLLSGLQYSAAGDLVVGYGYGDSVSTMVEVTTTSSYRCAVRRNGSWTDREIDRRTDTWPADPTVAVLGSGSTMQIFYGWETADGVNLAYSSDGGQSFAPVAMAGAPGAMMPSIHARQQGAETRVDMLYLTPNASGMSLHNLHFDDFSPTGAGAVVQVVVEATVMPAGTSPFGTPAVEYNCVGWMGFDAVTDGDDVAVVVHDWSWLNWDFWEIQGVNADPGEGVQFMSAGAAAAPYAPGLTDPWAAPDPSHSNQLRILILD